MAELSERTAGAERAAIKVVGWLVWEWYVDHKDSVVVRRKVLGVFSIVITVADLRPLFVRLFGEPQEGI